MAEWRNGRRSGLKTLLYNLYSWATRENSQKNKGDDSDGDVSGGSGGTNRGTWWDAGFLVLLAVTVPTIYILANPSACQQREVEGIEQHNRDLDAKNREHLDRIEGDNTAKNNAAVRGDDGIAKLFAP